MTKKSLKSQKSIILTLSEDLIVCVKMIHHQKKVFSMQLKQLIKIEK